MRSLLLVCLVACSTPAPPAVEQPAPPPAVPVEELGDVVQTSGAFTYRVSRMTYLGYTLDCLAKLVPCSASAFTAAWADGWSADDDAAIAAWATLRTKSGIVGESKLVPTPLPIAYRDRDVGSALRIAIFGAPDIAAAVRELTPLLSPEELAAAQRVLERFSPRITPMWRSARAIAIAALPGYIALHEREDVRTLLAQIAALFTVDAARAQTFELIGRPAGKGPTSAQQLGDHSVVEVVEGEQATRRFPVITHEMFHAWFGASPIAQQVALLERVLGSKDALTGPAWGLLDESLATALGNGLVARLVDRATFEERLADPLGFYNDPYIDSVAKALLPVVEKHLAAGHTIFDPSFATDYLAAVRTALPKALPPAVYLRPLYSVAPEFLPAARALFQAVKPNYFSLYESLDEARQDIPTGWGKALFVTRAQLPALAPFVPAAVLAKIKKQRGAAFVYAVPRPVGSLFVFVAEDLPTATTLVEKFATLESVREGVVVP